MKNFEQLFGYSQTRTYKKGETLMHAGDELTHVFHMIEGYVKVYKILETGEERIVALQSAGDSFPLLSKPQTGYELIYYYEAMSDVEVGVQSITEFIEKTKNPETLQKVLHYLSKRSVELTSFVSALLNKDAQDQLQSLLSYLFYKAAKKDKDGYIELDFKVTHQDLADLAGLARETVTNNMKKLKKSGVIKEEDGSLYFKKNELKLF